MGKKGANWQLRRKRRRERQAQFVARAKHPEMIREAEKLGTGRPTLSPADAQVEVDRLMLVAKQLGEECRVLLEAESKGVEPRGWDAASLRKYIVKLKSEESRHEAIAVERYADARVDIGRAINILHAARDYANRPPEPANERPTVNTGLKRTSPKYEHPDDRKKGLASEGPQRVPRGPATLPAGRRPPEEVCIDPVTSQAISVRLIGKRAETVNPLRANRKDGRQVVQIRPSRRDGWSDGYWVGSGVIPANPPAWHATTPPWEDGPG